MYVRYNIVCSKWFTKNSRLENARVVWIVECADCGLQTCSWYLALSRRRLAKSSKCSRSKSNSLPPTKRFDFTIVDDYFEELQHSVSEKNVIHPFNGWAAVMVPCAGPIFEKLHAFFASAFVSIGTKLRCNSSKSSSTMVKSIRLVGGRLLSLLQEGLEDLAFLCRLAAWTFQTGLAQGMSTGVNW